jgi:dephospho-CoA kinase
MTPHSGLFLFGLTGGVASGKSTVGKLLGKAGVHVIDADDLARRAVAEGQPALTEIERKFGSSVLSDGELDRAALGKIVFADPERLAALNAIIHPRVAELLRQELLDLANVPSSGEPRLVCYEVPLLFENNLDAWLRPVVLVACSEEQQVARAMAREGWPEEHARQRVRAQLPLAAKQVRADYVIHNDATLEALSRATELTLDEIRKLAVTVKPS